MYKGRIDISYNYQERKLQQDNIYHVRGIVLEVTQLNEYDKRLVILSAELGRITVFANGARHLKSPVRAISQKFVMGTFDVAETHSAYKLVDGRIERMFSEISFDLDKFAYASYICEMSEYFTREGVKASEELNLIFFTFQAILKGDMSLNLIRAVFEIKILQHEGLGLTVHECIKCGSMENLKFIDYNEGGVICKNCADKYHLKHVFYVSAGTIYILQYILTRKNAELYSFSVNEETEKELSKIVFNYSEYQCDRHFKSLDILKTLM